MTKRGGSETNTDELASWEEHPIKYRNPGVTNVTQFISSEKKEGEEGGDSRRYG